MKLGRLLFFIFFMNHLGYAQVTQPNSGPDFAAVPEDFSGYRRDQGPLHGIELTFTNKVIKKEGARLGLGVDCSRANALARDLWGHRIDQNCKQSGDCFVRNELNRWGERQVKIQYADGFYFLLACDPFVVEVQAAPMTLDQAKKMKGRFKHDLFDTAAKLYLPPLDNIPDEKLVWSKEELLKLGRNQSNENKLFDFFPRASSSLRPDVRTGMGHLHYDILSTFNNNTLLFRNFIVDYSNHPSLGMGLFGNYPHNAPPIAALDSQQFAMFKKVIENFDLDWKKGEIWSIKKLATQIVEKVYTRTIRKPTLKDPEAWTPASKYQALNFDRIYYHDDPTRWTMEIRGNFPPQKTKNLIVLMELFDERIEYLKKFQRPIPIIVRNNVQIHPLKRKKFSIPVQQKMREFYRYTKPLEHGSNYFTILLAKNIKKNFEPSTGLFSRMPFFNSNN